jgi:thiol peroxidase
MQRKIYFKNKPVTLVGRNIKVNTRAPEFTVTDANFQDVHLYDFNGKIKIITSFFSLDTSVCDLQVREFEKRAAGMSEDIVVLGISKDLPFAQKRFCQANNIEKVRVFSDYRYSSFAVNYGLLIRQLNLLARAIVILDKNNNIRYNDVLKEAANTPDFDFWLKSLQEIIREPSVPVGKRLPHKCVPCEAGTLPLDAGIVKNYMHEIKDWQLQGNKIVKEFRFKDFTEAKYFVDLLAIIAREQGHHPDLKLRYNKIEIALTTHAIGGLSENDFVMAGIIDGLEV